MLSVVRALFPAIIVLRLADSNCSNMDKLYYYVRRLDKSLELSKLILDTLPAQDESTYSRIFMTFDKNATESPSSDDEDTKIVKDDDIDDSDDSDSDKEEELTLGKRLITIWEHRKKKLVHPYSVSGWMVCPMNDVYNDAKANQTGKEHRDVMEALFRQMFEEEILGAGTVLEAEMMNQFWSEYEAFNTKSYPYDKEYIWKSSDLSRGDSYLWHKKHSLAYTTYFGQFACHVTSKILGIGAAERNWGAVKHLKTNKRSHLSSEKVYNMIWHCDISICQASNHVAFVSLLVSISSGQKTGNNIWCLLC